MAEFFAMGGYAAYVWSAYALTLVILMANLFAARTRFKSTIRQLIGKFKREERIRS